MKKFISIIIAFINFASLLILTLILNVNLLVKEKNIIKVSNRIDYLSIVDVKDKKSELKSIYDNIYSELVKEGLSSKELNRFYNSKYVKNITAKIIYNETNYLLYGKEYNKYTVKKLNTLAEKELKDKDLTAAYFINYNFVNLQNNSKYVIDSLSYKKLAFIRFIFSNAFKIILLSIIIISVILEYILNKEKIIPYIFTGSSIVALIEIVSGIISTHVIYLIFNNNFLYLVIKPFISYLSKTIIYTGMILIGVSIIYLALNEKIDEKYRIIIKPKIKIKR